MQVGQPGISIPDGGGEEFQKAAGRLVTGVGDYRGHDDRGLGDPRGSGGRTDGQLAGLVGVGLGHGLM